MRLPIPFFSLLLALLLCLISIHDSVEGKVQRGTPASAPAASGGGGGGGGGKKSATSSSGVKRGGQQKQAEQDDEEDEDGASLPPTTPPKRARGGATAAGQHQQQKSNKKNQQDEEESIEDVDEDKIDDIVDDNEKNLVIIFYDSNHRCPHCKEALKELEEIDDDLEATGYIEVVKSDDKKVAKELGVHIFPALIYYRRKNPILYDGEFKDSETILKWIRAHEYVAAESLDDDNFEEKTDSYSPSEGALDWFVMFYNSKQEECNAYSAVWETVAHKLRGIVHVGKLDVAESDDVAERFHIDDDNDCPTFLFFRRGKLHRYKDAAKDVKSFVNFALYKFKETRGHRVPDPPTLLEGILEDVKEEIQEKLGEHANAVLAVGASLLITILVSVTVWAVRAIRSKGKGDDKKD